MSVICNDITKILHSQLAIYDSHAWLLMMYQKHNVVIKLFVHIQSLNNDKSKNLCYVPCITIYISAYI